jgi:RNA polymerase sigma-70 factor (ECF subfamily)
MMTEAATTYTLDNSERLLVARCLRGEQKAWDELFGSHYRTVSSVASWKKWGFDAQEVEDVTQDIVVQIVTSLKTFEFKSSLSTFAYRIAVNTCTAHLREKKAIKRKTYSAQVALDPIESGTDGQESQVCVNPGKSQEELLLEQETLRSLYAALLRLEKRCKELIQQRYFRQMSFHEIAQSTGIKTNTLVVQLKRCLARLLSILKEEM